MENTLCTTGIVIITVFWSRGRCALADASWKLSLPALTSRPTVDLGEAAALEDTDQDLVGYLYRDSVQLRLRALSGGFSGARVFLAEGLRAPPPARKNVVFLKENLHFRRTSVYLP